MITYKQGDLLNVTYGFIAHSCNALGVMGSGVAKQIKEKYPKNFAAYESACKIGKESNLGYNLYYWVAPSLCMVNMITQPTYGHSGKHIDYKHLASCLKELRVTCKTMGKYHEHMRAINIPKIGSGLGGGDWNIIERDINLILEDQNVICWTL